MEHGNDLKQSTKKLNNAILEQEGFLSLQKSAVIAQSKENFSNTNATLWERYTSFTPKRSRQLTQGNGEGITHASIPTDILKLKKQNKYQKNSNIYTQDSEVDKSQQYDNKQQQQDMDKFHAQNNFFSNQQSAANFNISKERKKNNSLSNLDKSKLRKQEQIQQQQQKTKHQTDQHEKNILPKPSNQQLQKLDQQENSQPFSTELEQQANNISQIKKHEFQNFFQPYQNQCNDNQHDNQKIINKKISLQDLKNKNKFTMTQTQSSQKNQNTEELDHGIRSISLKSKTQTNQQEYQSDRIDEKKNELELDQKFKNLTSFTHQKKGKNRISNYKRDIKTPQKLNNISQKTETDDSESDYIKPRSILKPIFTNKQPFQKFQQKSQLNYFYDNDKYLQNLLSKNNLMKQQQGRNQFSENNNSASTEESQSNGQKFPIFKQRSVTTDLQKLCQNKSELINNIIKDKQERNMQKLLDLDKNSQLNLLQKINQDQQLLLHHQKKLMAFKKNKLSVQTGLTYQEKLLSSQFQNCADFSKKELAQCQSKLKNQRVLGPINCSNNGNNGEEFNIVNKQNYYKNISDRPQRSGRFQHRNNQHMIKSQLQFQVKQPISQQFQIFSQTPDKKSQQSANFEEIYFLMDKIKREKSKLMKKDKNKSPEKQLRFNDQVDTKFYPKTECIKDEDCLNDEFVNCLDYFQQKN